LASTYFVMGDPNFNILENLIREDYKYVRERLIGMILATDMANHFPDLAKLKVRLVSPGIFTSLCARIRYKG
jgi:3'5'-cyclic nucleotide phosphodiesterase